MGDKKGYDKKKVIKRKLLFPAEKFSFLYFFRRYPEEMRFGGRGLDRRLLAYLFNFEDYRF